MKTLRSLTAVLAAFVLLVAPVVGMAAEYLDGNTPSNGKPGAGELGASWTGSSHKVLRGDSNGILRITEEYPTNYQRTSQVLYSSTCTASATENTSPIVFEDASIYGDKWLRTKLTNYATGAAGLNGGFIVRPKGSVDGVTFQHILIARVDADSVRQDTLQFRFYANSASPSANGVWVPLVNPITGAALPFPFIQLAMINRGSATATVELEIAARER